MDECQDTISKLKFISRVSKGDKINSKELLLQSDGIVTKISRSIYNVDNRQNALTFIQNTINSGFNYLINYAKSEKSSEKLLAKNLFNDLLSAKSGITNLRTTYSDDVMFCCTLDTYSQSIDVRLAEFSEQNPSLINSFKFDTHQSISQPLTVNPKPLTINPKPPNVNPQPPMRSSEKVSRK